ncbi:tRNA lysidine(34) synthetase TilS [Sporocytophaga myxococcoides]|uniref:tRNA lysidine(34) synthetase TilS n=1 Tax=Sporocytophaga myxococcoides TaxID=153721 RepID=UPI0003FE8CCB|nr:tRNA lysidine(34) synthetase TilS [Sporocytophaga myxococcoides]
MLQRFLQFISEHQLVSESAYVLAAVSGGKDSVTMCELLHLAGINFGIAHCNFQLRGLDSDLDEQFVRKLATHYKVPFFSQRFKTETFAKDNRISIQMAARDLRYTWFRKLASENGFDSIATAHHLNDVFETILLNLTRGTGYAGLQGIQPRNGEIIRPLLFCQREEIDRFVLENNLEWREDISNASTKYYRNLIRHKVIPVLKEINPSLEQTAYESTEKIRAVANFFKSKISEIKSRALSSDGPEIRINLNIVLSEPEPAIVLTELLNEFGFTYKDSVNILNTRTTGSLYYSKTHVLNVDRQSLLLRYINNTNPAEECKISEDLNNFTFRNLSFSMNKITTDEFVVHSDRFTAHLDWSALKFPLIVRNWLPGDRFIPLGMKNFKKVSDFLIDQKTPLLIKNNTLVIISDEKIAWIVGMRIDDRFKITSNSKTALKITVNPPS